MEVVSCNKSQDESKKHPKQMDLRISSILIQVIVTFGISFGLIAGGTVFAITGVILPSVTDKNSTDLYMNMYQVSIYTSMPCTGVIIGVFVSSLILVRYGQRKSLLIVLPIEVIGWSISYFAQPFWLHCVSRTILGIDTVVIFTGIYTYVAEISHPKIRGKMFAIISLSIQSGFLFVYTIGSAGINWRLVGVICGLSPLVVLSVVLLLIPDSPRWLSVKGRPDAEVLKSLELFRGKSDYDVELEEIKHNLKVFKKTFSLWDQTKLLFSKMRKKVLLLTFLCFTINFAGDPAVLAYSASIFQSANTNISPYKSTIICGLTRIFGALVYVCAADIVGRRVMLLVSMFLSGVFTASLGIYFYLESIAFDISGISWLPLVSVVSFIICNCLSYPVVQLLQTELLPNAVRQLGMNLMSFVQAISEFLVYFSYPMIAGSFGEHWAFSLYTVNSLLMVVVIYFFLPETKGKTLEEIAEL